MIIFEKLFIEAIDNDLVSKKPTLNVVEELDIEEIGKVKAKVDTGNEAYNVLHGMDVTYSGNSTTFKTVNNVAITRPVLKKIEINIGSGNIEDRPVVEMSFTMHGRKYTTPFSIADRSTNDEPVLLGEVFLSEIDAVVDVNLAAASVTD